MADTRTIASIVRSVFEDKEFVPNPYNTDKYSSYTKSEGDRQDDGSVSIDGPSVFYYINGHTGGISPHEWGGGSKSAIEDDIEKHLWKNRDALRAKEISGFTDRYKYPIR